MQEQGGRAFPVALFTVFNMLLLNNNSDCVLSPRGLEFMSSLDWKEKFGLFVAFYCKKSGKEVRICNSSWSNSLKVVSEHVHFDLKRGNEEVCRLP